MEGSRFIEGLSGMPGGFVLVEGESVEAFLDTARVVLSVDIAKQRRMRLCSVRESGRGPIDQFCVGGRPQVLRERVVEVPDTAR